MLKKLKHGFTLVELVIVIAVIAVLAAVLIPTFITVIDNANNSADLQLVANMNTVLSTDLTADGTATAENLRKLLKDNGLDNLTTKNKKNIIAYNKETKKFEKIDFSKANFTKKEVSATGAKIASADDGSLVVDSNAYSPEEVFEGYIVVSTGGNEFSEALNLLHNLPDNNNHAKDTEKEGTARGNIYKGFKQIKDSTVKEAVTAIVNSCLYVALDGSIMGYYKPSNNDNPFNWFVTNNNGILKTRIVFNEELNSLPLKNLKDTLGDQGMTVVLPQTIESIDLTGVDDLNLTGMLFMGNTSIISEEQKEILTKHHAEVSDTKLSDIKDTLVKNGPLIAQTKYFLVQTLPQENAEGYYTDIQQAVDDAGFSAKFSGMPRSVVITYSPFTITKDLTIPKGVTLEIPFGQGNTDYSVYGGFWDDFKQYYDGENYYWCGEIPGYAKRPGMDVDDKTMQILWPTVTPSTKIADESKKQYEVTISDSATVTVYGTIRVGGVIGYTGQAAYQGHTSGSYGQITNNGKIVIEDGGALDVWGFVKGTGTVTANGGDVYEPLIVADHMGGTNTSSFYLLSKSSPFKEYGIINIQCPMAINYGANLSARCSLYIAESYFCTTTSLISSDPEAETLIRLQQEDSSVNSVYDATKCIREGIGKVALTVKGQAETSTLSLSIFGDTKLSTDEVLFPMCYNFDLSIDGHFTVNNKYAILPGASVKVNQGGTLEVAQNATLYVFDWLYSADDLNMAGGVYPDFNKLKTNNYNPYGELKVNGKMIVDGGAHAGGIVSSDTAGATLEIKAGANVADTNIQIGGVGNPNNNNSNGSNINYYKNLPLKIVDSTGKLTEATAGKTYTMGEVKQAAMEFSDIQILQKTTEETHDVTFEYYTVGGEVIGDDRTTAYFNKQDATKPTDTIQVSGGWSAA